MCLHRFDECQTEEAFIHPHPWPGAFKVISGGYHMKFGSSKDRLSSPENIETFYMGPGSSYEILSPLTWHAVIPVGMTYTIMMNGTPWTPDVAHTEVRTTAGKDLDKMDDLMKKFHLHFFKTRLERPLYNV